jgi:hypothetical protein
MCLKFSKKTIKNAKSNEGPICKQQKNEKAKAFSVKIVCVISINIYIYTSKETDDLATSYIIFA